MLFNFVKRGKISVFKTYIMKDFPLHYVWEEVCGQYYKTGLKIQRNMPVFCYLVGIFLWFKFNFFWDLEEVVICFELPGSARFVWCFALFLSYFRLSEELKRKSVGSLSSRHLQISNHLPRLPYKQASAEARRSLWVCQEKAISYISKL